MLPTINSYGNYSSSNYGAHCLRVSFSGLDIYYSYNTVIAFRTLKTGLIVSSNQWGITTGKHLNAIDGGDKKSRYDRETFEAKLNEVLKEHNL